MLDFFFKLWTKLPCGSEFVKALFTPVKELGEEITHQGFLPNI